jgi:hypothetical protein
VVNNAAGLEKEADKMGKKQMKAAKNKKP